MKNRPNKIDLGLDVIATVIRPGEMLGQREIAEICGCSRSLVHQIEKKALRKLRDRIRKEFGMDWDDFFRAKVIDHL